MRARADAFRAAGGVALFAAAALLASSPVLAHLANWGIMDWDQHTLHLAAARSAIAEFHQVPLWNPYNEGGVPLLANPESRVLNPSFALTLAFGEIAGPKLEIVLHQWLAMWGTALLLTSFGIGWLGSLLGALVFGLNTWYAFHMTVGHVWALNIAYVPLILLCQRRSLWAPVYVIPTALLLVAVFFGGGVYPLLIALLLLALQTAGSIAAAPRHAGRLLARLALALAPVLPLASMKLLPSAEHLARHPRRTEAEGGYTAALLVKAALDRDRAISDFARQREIPDQTLYLGVVPLALIAFGAFARPRAAAPFAGAAVILLWVAFGTQARPSLWAALHALPVFDHARTPGQFAIAAILPLCAVLGLGVDALHSRISEPRARALALIAISTWVLVDLVLANRRMFADAFPILPLAIHKNGDFAQLSRLELYGPRGFARQRTLSTTTSALYPAFLANRGSVQGYQVVPVPRNAVGLDSPDYRGEAFLDRAQSGARIVRWSPNHVELALEIATPDVVVLNQNFDPGWRVADPPLRDALATRGLVSARVEPGDSSLVFEYRPASFVAGAWISALAFAALLPLGARMRRMR